MFEELGGKLAAAVAKATDTAKQTAVGVLNKAAELAKQGAGAVTDGMQKVLDNGLASAAALQGVSMIPVVGPGAAAVGGAVKAGYDYALKGDKKYTSADPYLDGELKDAAIVHCGGDVKKEKVRRRKEREGLIAQCKASADPAKQQAAERLERDMVGVERARLSKHVYDQYDPTKQPPPTPPTGYLIPSEGELKKLRVNATDLAPKDFSFRAQIYKVDPEVGPIPPQCITAFRGTSVREDWTQVNIPQGLGRETKSHNAAMNLAQTMAKSGASTEFTGHSLGGGLASAAAVVTGIKATTQNSSGLHKNTTVRFDQTKPLDREAAKKFVDAYRIDGADKAEILSLLNKIPGVPDAIGEPQKLDAPKEGVSRLALHDIDAVIDSIEERKTADQQTLQPR